MTLDQNHSRGDPDGFTMCHKSGWTSEKGAQGIIQNFAPQHPKGEHDASDSPVRITLCPRPVAGPRPCSTPAHATIPASGNQIKTPVLQTICYFWNTLDLFFLLGSYFLGTQLNAGPLASPTTPCPALTLQPKTPGLSHLDNFDYQEASHYPLQQEPAAPGTTSGPATSAPISSLSASTICCCTSSAAKSKACLQCQAPWYNYAATNKGVIRCR